MSDKDIFSDWLKDNFETMKNIGRRVAEKYLMTQARANKHPRKITSFNQIKTMEEKLAEMDNIVQKIDILDAKVERYRPKTPQEKLELRSLDSGPYKQNLADFFKDKEEEQKKKKANIDIWWYDNAAHGMFIGSISKSMLGSSKRYGWTGADSTAREKFLADLKKYLDSQ